MNVKNHLKPFKEELNDVIKKNLLNVENKTIEISNLNDYKSFLEDISIKTQHGKTVVFTNANSWYIPTLVKNLLKSFDLNDTFKGKIGIVCTDKEGYEEANKFNLYNIYINIPLLEVNNTTSVKCPDDYTRMCFVKIVMIYHALKFGYTVLYLDPDMSILKPSIQYLIDKISENGLVLAGIKEGNMNTNIIGVKPEEKYINLFKVDSHTFNANILNRSLYNKFCGSDEEFLIIKDEYQPDSITFLDLILFPPGRHIDKNKKDKIMILHANSVSGLENKKRFLIDLNAWFL